MTALTVIDWQGLPITVEVDVHTWADGYGTWHAAVPKGVHMRAYARAAILAELALREGPNFAPESVNVELRSWDDQTAYYVEVSS